MRGCFRCITRFPDCGRWAWQHSKSSLTVRDAARGLHDKRGPRAKLHLLFVMLSLDPFQRWPLSLRLADDTIVALTTGLPALPPYVQGCFSVGPIELMPMYTDARAAKRERVKRNAGGGSGGDSEGAAATQRGSASGAAIAVVGGIIDLSSDEEEGEEGGDNDDSSDGLGAVESCDEDDGGRGGGGGTGPASRSFLAPQSASCGGDDAAASSSPPSCFLCRGEIDVRGPWFDCTACGTLVHVGCLADFMILHPAAAAGTAGAAVAPREHGAALLLERLFPEAPAPCPGRPLHVRCSELLVWQDVVARVRSRSPALLVLQPASSAGGIAGGKRRRRY